MTNITIENNQEKAPYDVDSEKLSLTEPVDKSFLGEMENINIKIGTDKEKVRHDVNPENSTLTEIDDQSTSLLTETVNIENDEEKARHKVNPEKLTLTENEIEDQSALFLAEMEMVNIKIETDESRTLNHNNGISTSQSPPCPEGARYNIIKSGELVLPEDQSTTCLEELVLIKLEGDENKTENGTWTNKTGGASEETRTYTYDKAFGDDKNETDEKPKKKLQSKKGKGFVNHTKAELIPSEKREKVSSDEIKSEYNDKFDEPFACNFCGKAFPDCEKLHVHSRAHAGKTHKCRCGHAFRSSFHLKMHNRIHTGNKSLDCTLCGNSYANHKNLMRHECTAFKGQKRFKCAICNKLYNDGCILKMHVQSSHTGETACACDVCGMKFSLVSNMKVHKKIHTGELKQTCGVCGITIRADHMKDHNLIHTGEKPYKCSVCEKTFRRCGDLSRHRLTHTGEKNHHCDVCGKSFSLAQNLHRHKRIHTGSRPYACDLCPKAFITSDELVRHKRFHRGEKPYSCGECGFRVSCVASLRYHRSRHTSERPISCVLCWKTFPSVVHVKGHFKRVHSGEKASETDGCEKAFSTSCYVISYRGSQTSGECVCEECGKTFSSKDNLSLHKHSHMSYDCDICNGTYMGTSNFKMHVQLKHSMKKYLFVKLSHLSPIFS